MTISSIDILGLCLVLYLVAMYYWPNLRLNHLVSSLVKQVDQEQDDEGGLTNCQVRAIQYTRSKLGALPDNAANRLIVSHTIRKCMLDEFKMRPTHVSLYYPVAVAVYFIPSNSDMDAFGVHSTPMAKYRRWRAPRSVRAH